MIFEWFCLFFFFCIGINRFFKGRSFIGKVESFVYVIGKGVIVELGFFVDEFFVFVFTGKLIIVCFLFVYIIVFVIGLLSNGMVLWVFFFRIRKRYFVVVYMVNLVLVDFFFVIWFFLKIVYYIYGNNWIYGEFFCKVFIGFFYGNMYCFIFFMICFSV